MAATNVADRKELNVCAADSRKKGRMMSICPDLTAIIRAAIGVPQKNEPRFSLALEKRGDTDSTRFVRFLNFLPRPGESGLPVCFYCSLW